MKVLQQYMPARVIFGSGSIQKLGEVTKEYANKVLLVTRPWSDAEKDNFQKAKESLERAGVEVVVYDKVVPNPTTTTINEASELARKEKVGAIVGGAGGRLGELCGADRVCRSAGAPRGPHPFGF